MTISIDKIKIRPALLWAAAIIAAAILSKSTFLSLIILPVLALMSLSESKKEDNKQLKSSCVLK